MAIETRLFNSSYICNNILIRPINNICQTVSQFWPRLPSILLLLLLLLLFPFLLMLLLFPLLLMLLLKLMLATLSDLAGTIFEMRTLKWGGQFYNFTIAIHLFISPDIMRKQIGYTAAMDKFSRFSAYAITKTVLSESGMKDRTNTDPMDASIMKNLKRLFRHFD